MRAAFFFGVPTFALVPADNVFSATLVSFAAGLGLFGLLCDDFLVGFLDGFLGTFFAAVFFTVFLAIFLAFFTERLPVLPRVFDAAALTARLGGVGGLFFPPLFAVFFFSFPPPPSFFFLTPLGRKTPNTPTDPPNSNRQKQNR